MNEIMQGMITIAVAIVGIATLAVIVGKNSQTGTVIKSAGDAFSNAIKAAVSPVS